MITPHAWALVFWGRLQCRWLGRHLDRVRLSHGYNVTFCTRCYGYSVERVAG